MGNDLHLSDQELLQAIDGELRREAHTRVGNHLAHCWRCRVRRQEMEESIAAFVRFQRDSLDPLIPAGEGPEAKLLAVLREEAQPATAAPRWKSYRDAALVACAAAVFVIVAVILTSPLTTRAPARSLPDSRLTPGAARVISREQVCLVPITKDDRAVPVEMASRVFRQYGIRPSPRAYEVDYLITPALGGAEDIRNLWPQPYGNTVWTARVKDALEDYLHSLVCQGKLELATAQAELAANWIAAYRKYFHSDKPLPAHALFLKDKPWE